MAEAPKRKGRLRGVKKRPKRSAPGKGTATSGNRAKISNQVPDDILNNEELKADMKHLPSNYEFEIYKTLWRIRRGGFKMVALQFPEGLLMYSCIISDILEKFAGVETLIMGDVTYGACCVDDYTAKALGCDFMVHYGHSCLVPIDVSSITTMYVFVDIKIDIDHFLVSVKHNFPPTHRIVFAGTVQFQSSIHAAVAPLMDYFAAVHVPQAKPLSKGEVLGCTSPHVGGDVKNGETPYDALIYLADGRFHLESLMIQNPQIPKFYKYDPYNKAFTQEKYDHTQMHSIRKDAIDRAVGAKNFGVILGTLGRQGNTNIMDRITYNITERGGQVLTVLLSEIFPAKLSQFPQVDAWIQVACPRLSIDWGYAFDKPLLSPYEAEVALSKTEWLPDGKYPMDFYRKDAGPWTNYFVPSKTSKSPASTKPKRRVEISYDES